MATKIERFAGAELIYAHDAYASEMLKNSLFKPRLNVAAINVDITGEPEFVNGDDHVQCRHFVAAFGEAATHWPEINSLIMDLVADTRPLTPDMAAPLTSNSTTRAGQPIASTPTPSAFSRRWRALPPNFRATAEMGDEPCRSIP